jgi:hypothetical protein
MGLKVWEETYVVDLALVYAVNIFIILLFQQL